MDSEETSAASCCILDSDSDSDSSESDFGCSGGVIRLCEDDRENVLLKHRLYSTLGCAAKIYHVVSIYKLSKSTLTAKARLRDFEMKSVAVRNKRSGNANVRFAWYGTTKEGVDEIINQGFDLSRTSENAGLYGSGVYLCPDTYPIDSIASATADSEGLLHLVLCQVILGNMEEVALWSKQSQPGSEEFDTGVDKLNCPKKYIIWPAQLETHISPIFILSIRLDLQSRRFRMEVPRKPTSPWISLVKLISITSHHLPSSKVYSIKKFYNDYTESKITRRQLVYYLRLIVGDKMLIAVLKCFNANMKNTGNKTTSGKSHTQEI